MEDTQQTTEENQAPKRKRTLFIFSNSIFNFLLHLVIVLGIILALLISVFNVYLPAVTNHQETITVPLLTEMNLEEAQQLLEEKNLRYEVIDSTYQLNYAPGVIIDQTPSMNEKVKLNRKIYLTVSSYLPPKVNIPDLIDSSVRNAEQQLKIHELKIGNIEYVDDLATNAVLKVLHEGKEYTKEELRQGVEVTKGSKVDLVVGNGLGKTTMDIPNVVGMQYDEAQTLLRGVGLGVGNVTFVKSAETPGSVIKQNPPAYQGAKIKIGEIVEIWVSEPLVEVPSTDSTATTPR